MPYPLKTYLAARQAARYSPQWAVSEADYREALRLVRGRLGRREIITDVDVYNPACIGFSTLSSSASSSAAGQSIIVEKTGGVWQITLATFWSAPRLF